MVAGRVLGGGRAGGGGEGHAEAAGAEAGERGAASNGCARVDASSSDTPFPASMRCLPGDDARPSAATGSRMDPGEPRHHQDSSPTSSPTWVVVRRWWGTMGARRRCGAGDGRTTGNRRERAGCVLRRAAAARPRRGGPDPGGTGRAGRADAERDQRAGAGRAPPSVPGHGPRVGRRPRTRGRGVCCPGGVGAETRPGRPAGRRSCPVCRRRCPRWSAGSARWRRSPPCSAKTMSGW